MLRVNTPLTRKSPAWTQEAYRPPCSEYSFCCPTRVPPPSGGGGGVPDPGTPPPPRGGGYLTGYPPPPWGGGVPDPGNPPPPPGGGGYRTWVPPPRGGTGPGYPPRGGTRTPLPPGVDRQTKWNYYLPVVLRTRAVIIYPFSCARRSYVDLHTVVKCPN